MDASTFRSGVSARLDPERISAALCAALLVLTATSSAARADAVDDYVRAQMAKRRIPGMSVAVIRHGRVAKEATYGLASIELKVPATSDTSYPLLSMTKIFTAAGIMQLVEQGKISLDEPVTEILPGLPEKWSNVTVRHCLSHTSGLPDTFTDDINISVVSGDRDTLLEQLRGRPVGAPGEKTSYNQTNYVVLGMIIEKLTGLSYEEFVQRRLLAPAGVTDARFGDGWAIIPGRSDLYTALDITADHSKLLVRDGEPISLKDKIFRYGAKFFPEYLDPAAGLNADIRDLVKWEIALSDGRILKSSTLAEMATPYRLSDGKNGDFGFGFVVHPVGHYDTVSYGGGAATWRVSIPAERLTVIVLTNLQDSDPDVLAMGIANLYLRHGS